MRLFIIAILFSTPAWAHGPEQWIADKQLVDPVSHKFCCGPSDCHALSDGDVQEVVGGYSVKEDDDLAPEFIPYSRALPVAPDGRFHRCGMFAKSWGYPGQHTTRCFITPPGSS